MSGIFKPTYLVAELGELARLPDGAITNIGGVEGPTFTVGGVPVVLAGDPSSGTQNLQQTYDFSPPGNIILDSTKGFGLEATGGNAFFMNGVTGEVTIDGNLFVNTINGIDFVSFYTTFSNHLNSSTSPAKHTAEQISADDTNFVNVAGTNVQQVLESIDATLSTFAVGGVTGFEYIRTVPGTVWSIVHGGNSRRVQVTVWDSTDTAILCDAIVIIDANTISVVFASPQTGRAILMLF